MQDSNPKRDSGRLPADPEKRESMKTMAAAAVGVALFTDADWWPFGDDGLEEPLRILNDGDEVDDGVEELDFGNGVTVNTTDDGVTINVDQDFSGDVTTDSRLGAGTRSPGNIGDFTSDEIRVGVAGTGDQRIVGETFSDTVSDALHLAGVRYRGSDGSPAAVSDGDFLGSFTGYGYDGEDASSGASIQFKVDGTVSSGSLPSKMDVNVTDSNGSAFFHSRFLSDGTLKVNNGSLQSLAGGATYGNGALELGSNGARLELNGSGEIVVVDEAGNETVIS